MIIELEINEISELMGSDKVRFKIVKDQKWEVKNAEALGKEEESVSNLDTQNADLSIQTQVQVQVPDGKVKENTQKKILTLLDVLKIIKEKSADKVKAIQARIEPYLKRENAGSGLLPEDRTIINVAISSKAKDNCKFLNEAVTLHDSEAVRLFFKIFSAETLIDLLKLETSLSTITNEKDKNFLIDTVCQLKTRFLASTKKDICFSDYASELITANRYEDIFRSFEKFLAFANQANTNIERLNVFDVPILKTMLKDRIDILEKHTQECFLLKARTLNENSSFRVLFRMLRLQINAPHFMELSGMINADLKNIKTKNLSDYNALSLLFKSIIDAHTKLSDAVQQAEFDKADHQNFVAGVRKRFEGKFDSKEQNNANNS